jgi:hypothetical protein
MRAHVTTAILMTVLLAWGSEPIAFGQPAAAPYRPDVPRSGEQYLPGVPLQPLPSPNLGEHATAEDCLRAASAAVIQDRAGEARQALEMAQTRLLDRSVPLGQTRNPSENPAVRTISLAMRSLANGDRATTLQQIQEALRLSNGSAAAGSGQ